MDYDRDRLCKDCKYSSRGFFEIVMRIPIYRCKHPDNLEPGTYNPVTGETSQPEFRSCGVARIHNNFCGPAGIKWAPKNSRKHLFTVLRNSYDRTT